MYNLIMNDYDHKVYQEELLNFLPTSFIDCHAHIWKSTFTPQGEANGGSTWIDAVADEITAEDLMDSYAKMFPKNKVTPLFLAESSMMSMKTTSMLLPRQKNLVFLLYIEQFIRCPATSWRSR